MSLFVTLEKISFCKSVIASEVLGAIFVFAPLYSVSESDEFEYRIFSNEHDVSRTTLYYCCL